MAFRIKNNKLNILWPITILKFGLPFITFTFFGQSFLVLATIFDCRNGNSFVSTTLKCKTGLWFSIFGPMSGIALFLQSCIAIITSALYFKPIFYNCISDLLKKTNSFPDTIFIFTKISINILFISDKGIENEHWTILFFLILFTGINAYFNLYYQNRANKVLTVLNNIFCLLAVSAYISLLFGKIFKVLEFTGSIYLFFSGILIIIIYTFLYKNNEIDYILINYTKINNPVDYLYYVSIYYKIILNKNNSRNYLTILKSLISKIEENCIIPDCPLKKYLDNLKKGIECPFLLNQYCEYLFQYGISKFCNDVILKNNYSIFLITQMNYQKKALIILNGIKNKTISFQNNYYVYRTLKLIDKWNFSLIHKNNSTFIYNKKTKDFKLLIKKLTSLYYNFMSLILDSKAQNIDNFNKINKIGIEIMNNNPKIEEIYNNLIKIQTDNIEIKKLYLEFVEDILKDEEKIEKCKAMSTVIYNNDIEINEKDYSNFNIEHLNEKGNLPYLIVSAKKENLGKIIDMSMNACKVFGYTKNWLIGQNINILIPKLFQKKHDLIIKEDSEKFKLKIFDKLNKKIHYLPDFIKKEVYGISKMKLLIELKLEIYFIKTEENKLVYIVEITNYNNLKIDLIKNSNNESKFCILTDDNFLIQTFTPNCIEYLKLNYNYINSNISIINFIKQIQDDLKAIINNTSVSRNSILNNSALYSEERLSDNKKNKNPQFFIKEKILNDLLNNKYSKKIKILWRLDEELKLTNTKSSQNNIPIINRQNTKNLSKCKTLNSENIIFYTKSNTFKNKELYRNCSEVELELYMEIKKIIIKKELLGFYFFFTKIKEDNFNNMSYILKKSEILNEKYNLTKFKKYQCKFVSPEFYNNVQKNKINDMFCSLIIKPSEYSDKSEISDVSKRGRRKSLDKRLKVSFKEEKKISSNDYSFIYKDTFVDSNRLENENDVFTIRGDFVPKFTSHFSLNVNNMSYVKIIGKNDSMNYLKSLEKEAINKKKAFLEQISSLIKQTETSSYESEEYESDDISSSELDSKIDINESNINSLNDKKEKNSLINNKKTKIEKDTDLIDHKNTKKLKKNNIINDAYTVNLSHIRFMIFDFYRDMVVEGSKKEVVSKIDNTINKLKNLDFKDLINDQRLSFLKNKNKNNKLSILESENKKGKKAINKNNIVDSNLNKINEQKSIEKKIFEALNNHKDELSVKRLKFFSSLSYILMIVYIFLFIILDLLYIGYLKKNLNIIINIIYIKYCHHISVYYLRELTLLNFNIEEIEGGEYYNIPAKDKEEYISLIKEELLKLFKDNQSSMKIIYSSSLSLSKNATKFLSEKKINIKMLKYKRVDINVDILTALMHYNSAFYNLASATTPIEQNHSDLYNYIYNNLNGYKKGINILLNIYINELQIYNYDLKLIIIFGYIFLVVCFSCFYFFIVKYFLSAVERRGNYMKVFYGINENILKNLISNCENLMNKLKSLDEQKYNEEESISENSEEKITDEKNQIQKISNQNYILNNDIENKKKNKASTYGLVFIILYGLILLISFGILIYNGIYTIKASSNTILTSKIYKRLQHVELALIDMFNVYREFLFDNQSVINEMTPLEYLIEGEHEELVTITEDTKFLFSKYKEILLKNKTQDERSLCSYYINDFFDSSSECHDIIGLISKYEFDILSFNFLEEIKINKNIVRYKLKYEQILGNLTEYSYSDYVNNELIPRKDNNNDYRIIFRLDLFNNETLHYRLNIIFFSIILPYLQENRNNTYNIFSFSGIKTYLLTINLLFLIIKSLIYFFYFIPIINFINSIIYKTKNMLSIVPLSILSSQNNVLTLLNISNNK